MKIDIGAACREAIGIWRRDRDVIVAVAGAFFFLPNLALQLFVLPPADANRARPDDQAVMAEAIRFVTDNLHWLALHTLAELIGVATLLALLLDPARPTVGEALGIVGRRLPVLIAAALLVNVAIGTGLLLFLIPGLYAIGRTTLVMPVLLGEPGRRFGEAVSHALSLTRGRVAQLLSLWGLIFFGSQFIQLLLGATARVASFGGGNPVTVAMLAAAVSAVAAATMIAFTLVRATLYRALASKG